jgi:hypothetical protein
MTKRLLVHAALMLGLLAPVSTMAASASASKTTAPPGTQIVDSKGTVIGNFIGYSDNSTVAPQNANGSDASVVSRQISGGPWVAFEVVTPTGSGGNGWGLNTIAQNQLDLFYTSTNCTGTPYMQAQSIPVIGYPVTASGGISASATIYYAAPPYQLVPMGSFTQGSQGGACNSTAQQVYAGLAATANVSFVPPFSLQ